MTPTVRDALTRAMAAMDKDRTLTLGDALVEAFAPLEAEVRALREAAGTVLKEYGGALDYARIAPRDSLMPMARAMLELADALDAARRKG